MSQGLMLQAFSDAMRGAQAAQVVLATNCEPEMALSAVDWQWQMNGRREASAEGSMWMVLDAVKTVRRWQYEALEAINPTQTTVIDLGKDKTDG